MSDPANPLTIASLVDDAQYRTLAAIAWDSASGNARNPRGSDGVAKTSIVALAKATSDEDAFRWLWTLLTHLDDSNGIPAALSVSVWNLAAESLPEEPKSIKIPRDLHSEIERFLALAQPEGMSPDAHHETFRVDLLECSNLHKKTRQRIANQLIEGGLDVATPIGRAAFDLLAESGQKGQQPLLIESVAALPSAQRVAYLRRVAVRARTPELRAAIVAALTSESLAPNAARLAAAALAELPSDELANLAASPWATASIEPLRGTQLAVALVPETLRSLVSNENVPAAFKTILVDQALSLPSDRMPAWATWLYDHDPDAGRALISHLAEKVVTASDDERDTTLVAVIEKLATGTEDEDLAVALASIHDTSGTLEALRRGSPSPEQQGRILAAAADKAGEYESALFGYVESADDDDLAPMLLELLTRLDGERHADLVLELCMRAFTTDAALLVALSTDHRSKVISAAKSDGPSGCLQLMALEAAEVTGDEVRELRDAVHWTKTSVEQHTEYANRLAASWPDELVREAGAAIDSLDKPQAEAIGVGHLAPLLQAVLDLQEGSRLADGGSSRFVRVLGRAGEMCRLACYWALQLPATVENVEALVAAQPKVKGLDDEFAVAREHFATELVADANDPTIVWAQRTDALRTAGVADSETARATALTFVHDEAAHSDARKAALGILGQDGLRVDEVEPLAVRAQHESDAEVHELLEALLRRVKSGDVGEALANLFTLVELEPDTSAEILLPVTEFHRSFMRAVDRVCRDRNGTPDNYITNTTSLVDLLTETALIEHSELGDGKGISAKEASLLRSNAPNKPKAGGLALRLNLLQGEFRWLLHVASLHRERPAHAAPAGSTEPHSFDDSSFVWADTELRSFLVGWRATMYSIQASRQVAGQE